MERRKIARQLFEMEAPSQTLADCDRRADEHFLTLDAMEDSRTGELRGTIKL